MRTNLVYLAGPITGQTYTGATDWRNDFKQSIQSRNPSINCVSPMRGKAYLQSLQSIETSHNEKLGILSGGPAILARDFADVNSSDMVVVNLLGATKVSIGTMFEVAWAHAKHIPIVLIMEKENTNVHAHSMLLAMCGFQVETIVDAMIVVEAFFA